MADPTSDWVRLLRVTDPGALAPMCFPATVDRAVAQLGPAAVDWAARTSRELALRSLQSVQPLTASAHDVDLIHLGVEPVVIATLLGIHTGRVEPGPVAPEIRFVLREYVRRHVPLDVTWASIVQGHGWLSERLMSACRDLVESDQQGPALELVARVLFGYLTPLGVGVREVYAEEQRLWEQSTTRSRDLLVRAVLAGERGDAETVSDSLRYRIEHRVHLGLILWRERLTPGEPGDVGELAEEVLELVGAARGLTLPVGSLESWAWGSSEQLVLEPDRRQALSALLARAGARAALGSPAEGLQGFRRTHEQAVRAARIARLLGEHAGPVIGFVDVSLVSLLSADLKQAREFVADELGPLAGGDHGSRDLRETVLAYLECHRSPQSAATVLFVARNTVTYRVKRAEALLGRGLGERETQLRAALLLARIVGMQDVAELPGSPRSRLSSIGP